MGIRCYCPNGHKLNLKSFLAGKTGVCPKCKIQFQIPEQSDPDLERAKELERSNRGVSKNGSQESVKTTPAKSAPQPSRQATTGAVTSPTASAKPTRASTKQPNIVAESKPKAKESTAEIPEEQVWYVRPPSGGEYGPASPPEFDGWLTEGRVTPDSYVWFTGWPDWKKAVDALPDRFSPSTSEAAVPAKTEEKKPKITAAVPNSSQASTPSAVSVGGGSNSVADPAQVRVSVEPQGASPGKAVESYRRKKSKKTATMVVVLLTLACAVLLAGLVWAIQFR